MTQNVAYTREDTEKAFGIPVWDLHSCKICGSVLLANTVKLHIEYHKANSNSSTEPKSMPKNCPVCGLSIDIPLDFDGAMILDVYDDHIESHEEE